jgi:hypothetical protein
MQVGFCKFAIILLLHGGPQVYLSLLQTMIRLKTALSDNNLCYLLFSSNLNGLKSTCSFFFTVEWVLKHICTTHKGKDTKRFGTKVFEYHDI